jgi:hypothetical protein
MEINNDKYNINLNITKQYEEKLINLDGGTNILLDEFKKTYVITKMNPSDQEYQQKYPILPDRIPLADEQLLHLKSSILLESTPLGNIAFCYDHKRETFVYYSDSIFPYRILETVCRKYVTINNCSVLYIDMSEELKKIEERKQAKLQDEEKKKQEDEKQKQDQEQHQPAKKDVFAKLKNYNKTSTKSTAPTSAMQVVDAETIKERANRYTCDGRFSNFPVLQKVDKKIVDKRLTMSFAEYKNLQKNKPSII